MASFKQNKKGHWFFVIDVGDGSERKQKTFSKDDEGKIFEHEHQARSYAEKVEKQLAKGRKFESVKIKDFITEYFQNVVIEEVSPTTYANQWAITQRLIIPHIGNKYVDKITDEDLDKYFSKRLKERDIRASLYQVGLILSKFFKYCMKKRKITDNPMKLVNRPAYIPPEKVVWTPEQVDYFLENTKERKFYTLYVLAEATGARRGELLALQWNDIDFDRSRLTINKALKYTKDKGLHVSFTKTPNSRRTVTIPNYALEALRAHKEQQVIDRVLVFDNFGEYFSPGLVSDNFLKDTRRLGLPESTLHGLRHAHATYLLTEGFSVADVAARLGDKRETIMKVYAHALPNTQNEIAAALDRRKL